MQKNRLQIFLYASFYPSIRSALKQRGSSMVLHVELLCYLSMTRQTKSDVSTSSITFGHILFYMHVLSLVNKMLFVGKVLLFSCCHVFVVTSVFFSRRIFLFFYFFYAHMHTHKIKFEWQARDRFCFLSTKMCFVIFIASSHIFILWLTYFCCTNFKQGERMHCSFSSGSSSIEQKQHFFIMENTT